MKILRVPSSPNDFKDTPPMPVFLQDLEKPKKKPALQNNQTPSHRKDAEKDKNQLSLHRKKGGF
jgi:hypothetical protein